MRRLENCQPSSKWVPFSNKGRIRQRKERNGICLSSAMPKIQWDSKSPQKLTQLSPRSHPRHLVEERTAQKLLPPRLLGYGKRLHLPTSSVKKYHARHLFGWLNVREMKKALAKIFNARPIRLKDFKLY